MFKSQTKKIHVIHEAVHRDSKALYKRKSFFFFFFKVSRYFAAISYDALPKCYIGFPFKHKLCASYSQRVHLSKNKTPSSLFLRYKKQTNKQCNHQQREVKDGGNKSGRRSPKQAPSHSAFQFEEDFIAVRVSLFADSSHTHKKKICHLNLPIECSRRARLIMRSDNSGLLGIIQQACKLFSCSKKSPMAKLKV